jgi:flagellar hook-length control protein FliK
MPESKVVDNDLRSLALQGSSPLEKAPEGPVVTAIAGTEAATAQPKFTFTAQVGSKDALGGLEAASSTKHALPTGGEAMAGQITQAKVQQAVAPSVSTIAKSVTAFSQVEGTIRWMVRNQEKSAELQLHPDKLGQVNISLRIEGQEVHARIWASEAATVPILQEHRSALEQSLREQGLNLGSFDLQSGNRGEDAQTGSQNRGFTPAESRAEALNSLQDVPTLASQILGNAHQIEVFA